MTRVQEREVYSNAPVVLVALEVRHTPTDPLTTAERNLVKRRLAQDLPIMRTGQIQQVTLLQAAGGFPSITEEQTPEFPRYFSRDNTMAVSVRNDAVVIETTKYARWEKVRATLASVLDVRQEIGGIDGVERIGLRYIDEIRVPNDNVAGWKPWVHPSLLGPAPLGEEMGLTAVEWQAVTVFTPGLDRTLVLRYGPREGFAVNPGGDLKRPTPSPGPFFLLDIDSFWTGAEGTPEFDPKAMLEISDGLHAPVRALFERLITERLREEVFRRGE